jgi:alpha-D-ribose 1-methylphosphonate 5-triphosphate synthase subunit PhnL
VDLQMITYHDDLLDQIKRRERQEDARHQLTQLLGKKYKFYIPRYSNAEKLSVRKRGFISFIKYPILMFDESRIVFDKQNMKIRIEHEDNRDKFEEELANDLDKYFPEYEILVR